MTLRSSAALIMSGSRPKQSVWSGLLDPYISMNCTGPSNPLPCAIIRNLVVFVFICDWPCTGWAGCSADTATMTLCCKTKSRPQSPCRYESSARRAAFESALPKELSHCVASYPINGYCPLTAAETFSRSTTAHVNISTKHA